ncbi:MAG: methyltransferase type 11, partial [Gemmatimonas sp.]
VRNNPDLWAACIAGALPESELAEIALTVGLRDPRIVERFDCFRDTTAEVKVAQDLHVHSVNFYARKATAEEAA